jgi:hypothetical protein
MNEGVNGRRKGQKRRYGERAKGRGKGQENTVGKQETLVKGKRMSGVKEIKMGGSKGRI